MSLFATVGVERGSVAVIDKFSDFRVEQLYHALDRFPELLEGGRPIGEILGTQLYFLAQFVATGAISCKLQTWIRIDRLYCLQWAACVVHSYRQNCVTGQNFVSCYVGAAAPMASGKLVNEPSSEFYGHARVLDWTHADQAKPRSFVGGPISLRCSVHPGIP